MYFKRPIQILNTQQTRKNLPSHSFVKISFLNTTIPYITLTHILASKIPAGHYLVLVTKNIIYLTPVITLCKSVSSFHIVN